MKTFLINATNLKAGGGIQVAQSICDQLRDINEHRFIIVLSSFIDDTNIYIKDNAEVYHYDIKHDFRTVVLGRDSFLDELVKKKNVDAVLTIFGPSIWRPKVSHLCGFARAQIILKDSPYYKHRSIKERVVYKIWEWAFKRCAENFYTENEYISHILEDSWRILKVYTVTNYYNQVFDSPDLWKRTIKLPAFNGVTCLSVSSPTPHKNFGIIEGIVRYLRIHYPAFNIRFVLTCSEEQWPMADDVKEHIVYVGKTDVSECPYLYEQSDIMFMPSLLECFTATYPEAMRMERPIVTTDLAFAQGLCGEAAFYYSAVNPESAAEALYRVATDKQIAKRLIEKGKEQLKTYDNYEERARKLVNILEEITI